MPKEFRSKNPDLLIPEVMEERVKRTTEFWSCRTDMLKAIDRITAFVTHRCNLACEYCNGPHLAEKGEDPEKHEMLKDDLSVESFERLLREAGEGATINHIHFTGGEPTLNKNMPRFVEMAKAQGILSSITTNGTANPKLYGELIRKGLTEIRISIDSHSDERFDTMAGVKGTFEKVVRNIREIVRLRDEENADVFLVLNVCVGKVNLEELEKTLKFLIGLDPNDIKFLVIAQEKDFVVSSKTDKLIVELKEKLNEHPLGQFTLLRDKIDNLFNPNATGLRGKETQRVMEHCFVPMTERTVDAKRYYPCSIYLRYYGEALGFVNEPYEMQQAKVMKFIKDHDCRKDPICSRQCTNCCKVFNEHSNQQMTLNPDRSIEIENDITEEEIVQFEREINHMIAIGKPSEESYMVIKPHGQQWREGILEFLKEKGIRIRSSTPIPDWPHVAKYLYTSEVTRSRIIFSLEMDRAFRVLEKGPGEILRFTEKVDPETLYRLKLEIRKRFPPMAYQMQIGNKSRRIRVNPVHAPDAKDLERENWILDGLLRGK
jgi:MoaA/NifB/PqqE/SkfB family radical SAM enzyme